jgi:hypothetical protein
MSRYSINPHDSRCDDGTPVSVIDATNSSRVVSCHASMAEAIKAKMLLLFDPTRAFGDPELPRFPTRSGDEALHSLAALNGREHRWQYTRAEYLELTDAVRAAVVHFYDVVPDVRDCDDPDDLDDPTDDPANDSGDDDECDNDDNDDDEDESAYYGHTPQDMMPYSVPYVTMSRPTTGEFERRSSAWPPAVPADRRRY